jgi:predicted negative regulator of RcsB-dependent stress response
LNGGIVYLMFVLFLIGGYIGYRWWKQEKANHS